MITTQFAKAGGENNVHLYIMVSPGFASLPYARMKGELQKAVKQLGFTRLSISNPPILFRKNSDMDGSAHGRNDHKNVLLTDPKRKQRSLMNCLSINF